MKIVILDSDSIFGKSLTKFLEKSSHQVILLSLKKDINLLNLAKTKKVFASVVPDVIYNFASYGGGLHYVTAYAADVVHINMQMALTLYRAVSSVCPNTRIVNTLANCSYPGNADIQKETEWFAGEVHKSVYGYGNVKRMQYVLSYCYKQQYDMRSINLIVPNHYGPGDYTDPVKVHAIDGMIIRMIQAKRRGDREFEIWGTGKPIREWGYIMDIARVLAKVLTIDEDLSEPVNIGQKHGYPISYSAKLIANALGFSGNLVFNTKYQDGAPKKVLDNRRFKKIFGDFKFTSHERGIKETVEYYQVLL